MKFGFNNQDMGLGITAEKGFSNFVYPQTVIRNGN